ncbi:MAG: hypothetical protein ACYC5G_01830 [Candidatus Doudnabacteria bacterium]
MAGGSISVETVETKPAHIETVIGMVAIVIAVIVAASILTININAANVIKEVGFWTGMAYRVITFASWLLAAALAGIGSQLVRES